MTQDRLGTSGTSTAKGKVKKSSGRVTRWCGDVGAVVPSKVVALVSKPPPKVLAHRLQVHSE
jgi:hypothetical protein